MATGGATKRLASTQRKNHVLRALVVPSNFVLILLFAFRQYHRLFSNDSPHSNSVHSRDLTENYLVQTTTDYFGYHPKSNNFTHEWLVNRLHGEPARIFFVHVGKTGGVSMDKTIPLNVDAKRAKLACLCNQTRWETRRNGTRPPLEEVWGRCYKSRDEEPPLGRAVLSHKHLISVSFARRDYEYIFNKVNTFMVTTRNPVSRIVSTFNYHRHNTLVGKLTPKRQPPNEFLFLRCFRDIDQVANALVQWRNRGFEGRNGQWSRMEIGTENAALSIEEKQKCLDLMRTILNGQGPMFDDLHHFHHNYEFYLDVTMKRRPEVPVVVVRTEHLWDDAKRLDIALGGSGTFPYLRDPKHSHHSHGSEKYNITSGLSSLVRQQAICCEIVEDIEAYQTIILLAINLNDTEKQETLEGAFEECGVEDYQRDVVKYPFSWLQWYNETCHSLGE